MGERWVVDAASCDEEVDTVQTPLFATAITVCGIGYVAHTPRDTTKLYHTAPRDSARAPRGDADQVIPGRLIAGA